MHTKGPLRVVVVIAMLTLSQGFEFRGCYGEFYSQINCKTVNTTISIISGQYGLSACNTTYCCQDRDNECLVAMYQHHFQIVQDACDGKIQCVNARVRRMEATECGNMVTEYAVIQYHCIADETPKFVNFELVAFCSGHCGPSPCDNGVLWCSWNICNLHCKPSVEEVNSLKPGDAYISDNTASHPPANESLGSPTDGYTVSDPPATDSLESTTGGYAVSDTPTTDSLGTQTDGYIDPPGAVSLGSQTGIIVGAVVLCIIALLLVTVIGMAIFIKRKQFAWADESKVLKRDECTQTPAINTGFPISTGHHRNLSFESTHTEKPTYFLPEGPGENSEEVHMYDDIIVEEECCSEKRNTAQELQPALKRIKKAQSSTPTGMAPGAPVVVADHCIGHVPHSVSVERQIPIRDSVCDNPPKDFDCKESPRSSISSYAEIENHNSSVKNNGSTNETTINNHILKVQVPEESHYLKLQPYPVASDVYTELNQQTLTDDLGTTGPQTVYYINQSVI